MGSMTKSLHLITIVVHVVSRQDSAWSAAVWGVCAVLPSGCGHFRRRRSQSKPRELTRIDDSS